MQKDVFGVKGDYITSPEISQVFGEVRENIVLEFLTLPQFSLVPLAIPTLPL